MNTIGNAIQIWHTNDVTKTNWAQTCSYSIYGNRALKMHTQLLSKFNLHGHTEKNAVYVRNGKTDWPITNQHT